MSDGLARNKIVIEIVISSALTRLSMSRFLQKIFTIYIGWVKLAVQFETACQRTLLIVYIMFHSEDYISLKLSLSCEVGRKRFATICTGRGHTRFWTCVFKLHLSPSMWPILVEFRLAPSELRLPRKERRKKEESVVKYKSADTLCRAA